ncbi:MAG: hypothetical protein HY709_10245 [Candidatus Latescibacteria bacterium]|nr:hypothetical protein [Candidatus Latescibacterota bacterium]
MTFTPFMDGVMRYNPMNSASDHPETTCTHEETHGRANRLLPHHRRTDVPASGYRPVF